jgi:hypothetical protein
MNDSRIRGKLRAQLVRFSGELSRGLCMTARRFVCEVLYGITASESVMLNEIGRTLNEEISLEKTETRLSSQLERVKLKECVERNVLSLGAGRIGRDTLLIVDISDITKLLTNVAVTRSRRSCWLWYRRMFGGGRSRRRSGA